MATKFGKRKLPRKLPKVAEFLQLELTRRKERKKSYSLRAFARDLGMSPPHLSMLLSGKRPFTERIVHSLCERLAVPVHQRDSFLIHLKLIYASSASEEHYYQRRLRALDPREDFSLLDESSLSLFSRWYYPAIYELWILNRGKVSAALIARRLKLPLIEAQIALERLSHAGFLNESCPDWVTTGKIKSATIRQYHQKMLELASRAVVKQSAEHRENSSVTLAIDPELLPEARERYRRFRKELADLLRGRKPSKLYAMNFQLFSLE